MKTLENGSNLDEIIFENRNKAYGAYFLRKNYKRNVIIALCITIGFLSMSVGTPYILTYMSPEVVVTPNDNETRVMESLKFPKDELIEKIEPPKIKLPENTLKEKVGFDINRITIVDDTVSIIDPLSPIDNYNPSVTGIGNDTLGLTVMVDPPSDIDIEDPPMVFKPFELSEQPDFIGGTEMMKKYIASKVKYPQEAKEMNIQGTVYVEFIVSSKGEIGSVKILRSVDPLLDNEAIRVVKLMPLWNPGKQSGYPVNVSMILPIVFKLY